MLQHILPWIVMAALCLIAILATPIAGRLLPVALLPMRQFTANGLFVLATVTAMLLVPALAFADDGTASTTLINFNSVIESVIGLAAVSLAAAGHLAVSALKGFLEKKTGLDLDSAVRSYLDPAIDKAVAYGQLKVTQLATDKATVDVHNETVAQAVNYLLARVPEALDHFGIDEASLKQMVEARLGSWLGIVVDPTNPAAPVTPVPGTVTTADTTAQ